MSSLVVLAIRTKVHGFNTSQERWIFMGDKIHSTPYFRGEVKPTALCCMILWHIKVPSKYEQRHFIRTNSSFPLPTPPALLVDNSTARIARELWWINQEFSRQDHSTVVLHAHISPGG
jgi:hypothetical protein